MTRALNISRIACGILVFISGLMGLGIFGWEPPIAGSAARPFQLAMHEAGYFLPIMTVIFLVTGISFTINRYAALSAIVLFPISLNILLFHSILEAGQLPGAAAFFVINCFLLWYYRAAYASILKAIP